MASMLRAIGQHGDPSSIAILARNPFESRDFASIRARLRGLGMIRDKESVDALIDLMKSSSSRQVDANMADFRLSLVVLTGTDQGPSPMPWRDWWSGHRKGFEVSTEIGPIPRTMKATWTEYWGLDRDYGRTTRREDRGGKDPR